MCQGGGEHVDWKSSGFGEAYEYRVVIVRVEQFNSMKSMKWALVSELFFPLLSYQDGVISVKDIDLVMSEGLGMRYAFIGPMETMHLNAPEGNVPSLNLFAHINRGSPSSVPPQAPDSIQSYFVWVFGKKKRRGETIVKEPRSKAECRAHQF